VEGLETDREEEARFEVFFRNQERHVLRVTYGVLGDRELARDAAQEAWMRFLRYVNGRPPQYSVPLLVTVALNVARDWQRQRSRRPEHLVAEVTRPSAPDIGDDGVLIAAIENLPAIERDAILLHYAVGLSQDEVAQVLKKRVGTVKSLLYRARTRLRILVEREEATYGQ
jgi:RNA polymerase sigma-70 factor (ECF subfamily)